jgi:hypothetical protein
MRLQEATGAVRTAYGLLRPYDVLFHLTRCRQTPGAHAVHWGWTAGLARQWFAEIFPLP